MDLDLLRVDEFWETVRFDERLYLLAVVYTDPDFVACSFNVGGVGPARYGGTEIEGSPCLVYFSSNPKHKDKTSSTLL